MRPATPEEAKDPMASMGGGRDHQAFAEFYAEYDAASGLGERLGNRVIVNGPIAYPGQQVLRDIANLKAALATAKARHPSLSAFLPVVAPASALPGAKNEYYKDEEALSDGACRRAAPGIPGHRRCRTLRPDRRCVPALHARAHGAADVESRNISSWAQLRVDALNHALRGIPPERSRYHICWGSWNGPHAFDVPLKDIIDLVLQVRVGHYSFEAANPRHAHEWRVWETVKLAPGKILIPGVISHATNIVEHPELVAERIVRLATIVGRENVMGGTDCGFAQSPFARRVHPSIMWAKLKSLVEGARIATEMLWGKRAAA